jgi:hypothetical protein
MRKKCLKCLKHLISYNFKKKSAHMDMTNLSLVSAIAPVA